MRRPLYKISPSLKQRGDTIVEVLIATTVASLILTTSAVTVSTTAKNIRGAQERSESVQALKGEIEMLRSGMDTIAADNYLDRSTNKVFCIDDNNLVGGPVSLGGANSGALTKLESDVLSSPNPYPAACVSGRYYISVEKPTDDSDTFAFHARWEGLNGHREQTTLYYRIHKEDTIATAPPTCPLTSTVSYTFDPGGPRDDFRSDNNRISGPSGVEPRRLGPVTLSLPEGGIPAWDNYTVTLISYDTHDLFQPDTDQQERFRAILRDGSGTVTYTSPYSTDVPTVIVDGVRQGPDDVFTGQTIGNGTTTLTAEHIGIGGNGFHVDTVRISCP